LTTCDAVRITLGMPTSEKGQSMDIRTVGVLGADVGLSILEVLYQAFGNRKYRRCPIWREKVEALEHGRETGGSFFNYR